MSWRLVEQAAGHSARCQQSAGNGKFSSDVDDAGRRAFPSAAPAFPESKQFGAMAHLE
jgi:hypothetical protein